jgi:hypothetical protein
LEEIYGADFREDIDLKSPADALTWSTGIMTTLIDGTA